MEYRALYLHHPSFDANQTLQYLEHADLRVQTRESDKFQLDDDINWQAHLIIIQSRLGEDYASLCQNLKATYPEASYILILEAYHTETLKTFLECTGGDYLLANQLELLPITLSNLLDKQKNKIQREETIQTQHTALLSLAISPLVAQGNWTEAIREITRVACETMSASRVSIWFYNKDRSSIICQILYNMETGEYEEPPELKASDYPAYYKALEGNRVIIANDAHTHPATCEFSESYLTPLNIKSILDAPIRLRGEMIGVVSHEQAHQMRRWSLDDQHFAAALADLVAHTIENNEHYHMEEVLHQSHEETGNFLDRLKTLHEVSLSLAGADDFDDLCRKAIILGRERLGFARLGLWFLDDKAPDMIFSSFGTDENGQLRDERGLRIHLKANTIYQEMKEEKIPLRTWENSYLYNHLGDVVGQGWLGVACLWDGHQVVGWISADNLNAEFEPAKYHGELLRLYGMSIGHLYTQKRIQSALQESEAHLKQAEAIAHLGNFSFDIQTQTVQWSDEVYHVFGQAIGTDISLEHYQSLLAPEDFERVMEQVNNAIVHKQGYEIEHDIVLDDGTRKHLFARGRPLLDTDGNVVQIFGIIQDISERIYAERQKIELKLNREKLVFLRDFVEHMTHDLKTPLAGLKATSYVLQKTQEVSKQQEQLERLDIQVNQLEKMIDDILTVARLDHMPEITFIDIQLNQLIEDATQQLQAKALQKEISFQLELAEYLPLMTAAPHELRRALLNLIENALNYTPKGGVITIRTFMDNTRIVCEVEDTGIGVDTADLSRIFEQFYRADNARSFEHGTGLGLVIVDKIVQLHQGEIQVDSTLGKGTKFKLNFDEA